VPSAVIWKTCGVIKMCYSGEIVVPRPKIVKKLSKKWSKSCQKGQNSTNSGGVWGGEIVVPRPSASASLTGRMQKMILFFETPFVTRKNGEKKGKKVFKNSEKKYFFSLFFNQ
jgi:hypothetical protein